MAKKSPKPPKQKKILMDVAELGRQGGLKRAANMSPEKRSAIARAAVQARWAAKKKAESTEKPAQKNAKKKKS
jgi:hypothetical protein